jgi:type VI secretion system protein ImpA
MLDLAELLAPTTEAPPCGKNLEYDPLFAQIARAATRIAPKESGAHKTGGQEPKWTEVLDVGKAFFDRSKDLRIAVYVTRALVQKQGVEGLATGLALIRELLDKYWDAVHPQIEEEKGATDDATPQIDGTMRLNALAALHDTEGLVSELRAGYLINTRAHGQLRVRDVEVALGRLPPNDGGEVPSLDTLRGHISAAVAAGSKAAEAVNACVEALAAIRTSLTSKLGVEGALEFKPLNDVLAPLKSVCDEAVPVDDLNETGSTGGGAEGPQPEDNKGVVVPISSDRAIAGEIRSREDAVRVLEKVCLYLEKHEPSNPAPLFIRRAERLMTKSFVQIVEDLLPDSLSSLELLAGKLESDSAASS